MTEPEKKPKKPRTPWTEQSIQQRMQYAANRSTEIINRLSTPQQKKVVLEWITAAVLSGAPDPKMNVPPPADPRQVTNGLEEATGEDAFS